MSTDQRPGTTSLLGGGARFRERSAEAAGGPRRHLRALADRRARMMPLGSAPLPRDWPDDAADKRADGTIAGAVATEIVGLLRKRTGRGPTRAKCAITGDLAVVTLADCLTKLERRLAAGGNIELVRQVRGETYEGLHPEAAAIVEELTHRQVVAYLTAQNHDPDLAILIFYFARPGATAS